MNQHCGELVSICEAYLAGIILSEKGAQNLNEELMVRINPLAGFSFLPQHHITMQVKPFSPNLLLLLAKNRSVNV